MLYNVYTIMYIPKDYLKPKEKRVLSKKNEFPNWKLRHTIGHRLHHGPKRLSHGSDHGRAKGFFLEPFFDKQKNRRHVTSGEKIVRFGVSFFLRTSGFSALT